MKPIMNPPPIITLGIENATTIIPLILLVKVLLRIDIVPINTPVPQARPMAVRLPNGTFELPVGPGSVGITQGNQVTAVPNNTALARIRAPAIADSLNALLDFILSFIPQIILESS